jgi:hypothetical protein
VSPIQDELMLKVKKLIGKMPYGHYGASLNMHSMEKAEYKNIFKNESKHFFYVSTHRLILVLVNKYLPLRKTGETKNR